MCLIKKGIVESIVVEMRGLLLLQFEQAQQLVFVDGRLFREIDQDERGLVERQIEGDQQIIDLFQAL